MVALATDGRPPFGLFLVLLIFTLTTQQVSMVNSSAAAMVPLGHVAGSAAAVVGATPQIIGALIGSRIDALFDGTITPLSIAFVISALVTVVATHHAVRVTR